MKLRAFFSMATAICAALLVSGCGRGGDAEPTVEDVVFDIDGLVLRGDFYRPARYAEGTPLVVLLHGSCRQAGQLLLYREMGRRLSGRGCGVIVPDQRGHGRSDGPVRIETAADLDFVGDVRVMSQDARRAAGLDEGAALFVAGHSFGGGVAAAAMGAQGVDGVISVSPGRRLRELFLDPGREHALHYVQKRKASDMGLDRPLPAGPAAAALASYDIDQWRGRTLPVPLLLIEGASELADDLRFSMELVGTMRGNVRRVVMDGAGHYFGTELVPGSDGREWRVESETVLESLVDTIMAWIGDRCAEKARNGARR